MGNSSSRNFFAHLRKGCLQGIFSCAFPIGRRPIFCSLEDDQSPLMNEETLEGGSRVGIFSRATVRGDSPAKQASQVVTHHKKNGSQQARNADIIIPRVLAAFLSLFILFDAIGCSSGSFSQSCWGSVVNPALIPFIWRCLFSNAAATFELERNGTGSNHLENLSESGVMLFPAPPPPPGRGRGKRIHS